MAIGNAASRLVFGFALGLLAASTRPVLAYPSDLDSFFGNGGVAGRLETDQGYLKSFFGEPFVEPSGRILIPGEIDFRPSVFRYREDGELDGSFGENGVAKVVVPNSYTGGLHRISIQADGFIIAAGYVSIFDGEFSTSSPLLVRFDTTGQLDPTFGDSGIVVMPTAAEANASLYDVVVRSDGTIVAIKRGYASVDGPLTSSILFFKPDGSLDPAFGDGGVVMLATPHDQSYLTAIAPLKDDSLVISGYALLAKLRLDGTPDPAFGSAGVRSIGTKRFELALNVEVDAVGRILVAGGRGSGRRGIFVRRFLGDGERDHSYGRRGRARISFARRIVAGSFALTPDGYAVVPAHFESGMATVRGGVIARFGINGERDRSFGRNGVKRVDAGWITQLKAVSVQPDGKLVVTGRSQLPLQSGFAPLLLRMEGGAWDGTERCIVGCGDGVITAPEECDDGNALNGDGCSAACMFE